MLLAQIPPPPFSGLELGPLDLRLYGVLIAIGAFLALRMLVNRYARFGGDPDIAEKAGLLALLGGFLGARIGYVIPRFLGEGGFIERPLDILAIWQGGLAFFGGLAGGALFVVVYVRVKQADMPAMADAVAPALPLAQAFGRWGNYFNQELYGRPTDVPWALQVEPPFRRRGFEGSETFHPTFLYESLWNFGLVGVLLMVDRAGWLKRRGSLMFVYLIGYGIGRGWIEALRIDTFERYFGLSRNNWIAIAVVLVGVVGLLWWERREPATATGGPATATGGPADATDEPADAHGPTDEADDAPTADADDPTTDPDRP